MAALPPSRWISTLAFASALLGGTLPGIAQEAAPYFRLGMGSGIVIGELPPDLGGSNDGDIVLEANTGALISDDDVRARRDGNLALSVLATDFQPGDVIEVTGLPPGLSFSSIGGTGQILGHAVTAGTYSTVATLRASDGSVRDAKSVTFEIVPPLLATTSAPSYTIPVNSAFDMTPSGANALGGLLWDKSAGVPAWLGIDHANGRLTGTPSVAGAWPSAMLTAVDQFDLASDDTPAFAVNVTPLIDLADRTFVKARTGQAYSAIDISSSASLVGTDGTGVAWSATGLPAGMSLSAAGVLSGTPTASEGDYGFTVVASKLGGSGQRSYTLQIGGLYLTGVTQMSAGANHACAIADGGLFCWGVNSSGQLGDPATAGSSTPVPRPVQVAGLESGVTQVAAGSAYTCAIHNGAAKCWGYNYAGGLGDGTTTQRTSPVQVVGLESGVASIALASSGLHSCALLTTGAVKCWGNNEYGQVGDGTKVNRLSPVQVTTLTSGVTEISIGVHHSCARSSGAVRCWGLNASGQLGDGTFTDRLPPTLVSGMSSGVSSIAAGGGHTCAVQGGAIKCWGYNYVGQDGDGTSVNRSAPVQVTGLTSGATKVAAGNAFSCGLSSGAVKCWGYNNGMTSSGGIPGYSPVQVGGLTSGVSDLFAGQGFACVSISGAIKCWGTNGWGNLGDGTTNDRTTPVSVLAP